jgi:phage tail-like protein
MAAHGQLTVQLGNQVVLISALTQEQCTIGRLPDNNLVLPHFDVSQHHAEIRVEAQGVVLTDLESVSGTLVDGLRLPASQPTLLRDGAEIAIGPYIVLFRSFAEKGEASFDKPTKRVNRLRPEPYVPASLEQRSRGYLQYLPTIFQENDFLGRYLQIFETIWEPLEQRQDHISMYFDPRTCPAALLPWFASWFGLSLNPHWPETHRRAMLFETIALYRWRGTKYGLSRMIEVCTGLKPEITEAANEPFVFRISVRVPDKNPVTLDYLHELVRAHKPAHAGYVLEVL